MNKKYTFFRSVVYVLIALAPVGVYAQEKPDAPKSPFGYTISKETTWFTEPVRADGSLNMIEAIDNWCRQGVTRENNIAADLCRALGVKHSIDDSLFDRVSKKLQLDLKKSPQCYIPYGAFKSDGDSFIDLRETQEDTKEFRQFRLKELVDLLDKNKPWTEDEYPELAAWLGANKVVLDRLVLDVLTGSLGEKTFYHPMLSEKANASVYDLLLPSLGLIKDISRALTARGLLRVGKGEYKQAIEDFYAVLVIGRSMDNRGALITVLVGYAIESIAYAPVVALACSDKLDDHQLALMQNYSKNLPEPTNISVCVCNVERAMVLDGVRTMAKSTDDILWKRLGSEDNPELYEKVLGKNADKKFLFDWDYILRKTNSLYDELCMIMDTDGPGNMQMHNDFDAKLISMKSNPICKLAGISQQQLEALEKEAAAHEDPEQYIQDRLKLAVSLRYISIFISQDPEKLRLRSDILADAVIPALVASVGDADNRDRQRRTKGKLIELAIALEKYKAKKGDYPSELGKLKSSGLYSKSLKDSFTCDFVYKYPAGANSKLSVQYILYSLGKNYKDDGGVSDENADADDIVVKSY